MKRYCVKQRKQTENLPGSENIVITKNRRTLLKSLCNECGNKKSTFIKNSNQIGTGLRSGRKKAVDFTWEKAIPWASDKLWESQKIKIKRI